MSKISFPPLPDITDKHKLGKLLRGPTEGSNWVLPGMLMCGPYPGAFEDDKNEQLLKRILAKGVDTFICLQEEYDPGMPEEVWRRGAGLRPYFKDAQRISKKELEWVQLPIADGNIAPDDVTAELVVLLVNKMLAGRVLYMHCFGGHGRTGVFVCLVLSYIYRISAAEALKRSQAYHDCRMEPQGVRSPQTVVQRDQVKRQVKELLACQPPELKIREEDRAVEMDAGKRGSMKPMKKLTSTASCPSLGGSEASDTPTGKRPVVRLKMTSHEHAMPDYVSSLPTLAPGASAKTKREAMLRQKSLGAATRRREIRKQAYGDAIESMELLELPDFFDRYRNRALCNV